MNIWDSSWKLSSPLELCDVEDVMMNLWHMMSFSHPKSFEILCLTFSNCQKNFLKTWGFFSLKNSLWFLWSHSSISSKQFAFIVPPSIDAPSSTTFQSMHYNSVTIAHHFTNQHQATCVKQLVRSTNLVLSMVSKSLSQAITSRKSFKGSTTSLLNVLGEEE